MDYSTLGRFGVLANVGESFKTAELMLAQEPLEALDRLGYSAVWVGALAPEALGLIGDALDKTDRIKVGTGIANIWSLPAYEVAALQHRAERLHPGRLLLGVGAGHAELVGEAHRKPYSAMAEYVTDLDNLGVPGDDVVLAALRDKMLQLSADKTAGALPAWMPVEHTAYARGAIGGGRFLGVVRPVVFDEDPDVAREIARPTADFYMGLSNYVNAWREFGFSNAVVGTPATDELIDALVAHGSYAQIADDLRLQIAAGANHVAVYPLTYDPSDLKDLEALAAELGLSR